MALAYATQCPGRGGNGRTGVPGRRARTPPRASSTADPVVPQGVIGRAFSTMFNAPGLRSPVSDSDVIDVSSMCKEEEKHMTTESQRAETGSERRKNIINWFSREARGPPPWGHHAALSRIQHPRGSAEVAWSGETRPARWR